MPVDENRPRKGILRTLLPYTTVLLIIVAIYCGWIFYSRRQYARQAEQAAHAKEYSEDAKVTQAYGSGHLKIVAFYADPGVLRHGEKGLVCYSVTNAATVEIEPGVEPVKPSLSRCVPVTPKKDTHYTLTAKDAAGHAQTAVTDIKVR